MSCSVSLTEKWGHWTVAKQPVGGQEDNESFLQ